MARATRWKLHNCRCSHVSKRGVYTVGNGSTGDIYGTSTETGTVITTVSFASTTHIFFNIKPTADYRIYNDGRYFKLFAIRVRSA